MSAWNLPVAVSVCGKEFVIRSDFRAVLDVWAVLDDAQLTPPGAAIRMHEDTVSGLAGDI